MLCTNSIYLYIMPMLVNLRLNAEWKKWIPKTKGGPNFFSSWCWNTRTPLFYDKYVVINYSEKNAKFLQTD